MNEKSNQDKKVYRVGIDARFFGLENKGLGRYTKELVEQLDEVNSNLAVDSQQSITRIEYYIFLRNDNFDNYKPHAKNIHKVKADYRWYSWKEQLFFPKLLKRYNLDLMHFTHFNTPIFYRGKFVVTIHDLILFHYPTIKNTTLNKAFYYFKLATYHLAIRVVTKRAILIIAISKFTKKDIVNSLSIKKEKIKVIYEGAEFKTPQNNLTKERIKKSTIFQKYGILNKYLLYVGNAYPHKNLERLVLAFQSLSAERGDKIQLVLVGKKDYFYEKLEHFIAERKIKNIIITDYISDSELEELYTSAEFFVFPSLYEGFGLPPLEALVRGVPVISSAESSLKEILKNNVEYFNPRSIQSMKKGIEDMLAQGGRILTPQEIKKIKIRYSWRTMAEEIMNIYLKLL